MASRTTDYSTWSIDQLISRVEDLETQLQAATQHSDISLGTPTPQAAPTKKKKKLTIPRPFDPSRYTTRLIALKFAYLGKRYNGFEHHVNNTTPLPTVEEVLWAALYKTKLILPTGDGPDGQVDWTGCEYSKCGRTDRGVSAFGQVVGVRVRSNRPASDNKVVGRKSEHEENGEAGEDEEFLETGHEIYSPPPFDAIKDELPYIQLLNRVLPPDIRVYAWCPSPGPDFSARFSCNGRRYRYFFTNPAFSPEPGANRRKSGQNGWLDIEAMQTAAKSLEGVHDYRNFCKIDPSKQITNFVRNIFEARIERVDASGDSMRYAGIGRDDDKLDGEVGPSSSSMGPELYTFTVAGSAFLWHQVRHMVAVLFLVGQGLEPPSLVADLLDVATTPSRPKYEMASDAPLVLWNCSFPAEGDTDLRADTLPWVYVGDEGGSDPSKKSENGQPVDAKFGAAGIMTDLWTMWRARKIEELLAGSLANVVAGRGRTTGLDRSGLEEGPRSVRVFDGSASPRFVGRYVAVMQRPRIEHHEVLNERYAQRKGLVGQPEVVQSELGPEI